VAFRQSRDHVAVALAGAGSPWAVDHARAQRGSGAASRPSGKVSSRSAMASAVIEIVTTPVAITKASLLCNK
jgi:hypothetical protein